MPKQIVIPDINGWDPKAGEDGEFVNIKGATIVLEHSLISLQKWEAKWHKPYLDNKPKTNEEAIDYIRCMTITQNVDPNIYYYIPESEIKAISDYIEDPMTATTFTNRTPATSSRKKDVVTAEIIYYLMIELGIPMEFRKWHLNQLMTLIKVCEIKNGGQKKMSKSEILAQNKALNAQRKAKLHTHG